MSFVLSVSSGLAAQEPPDVSKTWDIVYANAGDTELRLDLVQPAAAKEPGPAVLVIHGGAWREGAKEENRKLLIDFARRGYVAISPQYRFSPKDRFPAQVLDVKAAVRWIRSNASSLKVDPARIGAMGFSAGGHLALMLGLTGPADGFDAGVPASAPSSRVQAVVGFYPPVDLAAPDFSEFAKGLVKDFLGASAKERPDLAAKASPLTFVDRGDAPVLLFQGTSDELVPESQTVRFARALTTAGVKGRVELLVGAKHGFAGEEYTEAMEDTFAFFARHLKAPAGPRPAR
ncbi:MAG: alpha/beta hydrolase [Acidobacteriota bacterium]|nr:alpha/beta hydrolase [Acidobacteriota bacterium]